MWLTVVLLISNLFFGQSVSVITKEITLSEYNTEITTSCASLGFDYFDPTSFTCRNCPTDQEPDYSTTDAVGNAIQCKCTKGYAQTANVCLTTTYGACDSITCTSCETSNQAVYNDRSACVPCGNTTLGLGSDGECLCPSGGVLIDTDQAGNKLSEKQCGTCPANAQVITTDGVIAGKYYEANPHLCQLCPDPLMSMVLSSGIYTCRCPNSYTIVGVSGIGPQSCLANSQGAAYLALQSAAVAVQYYHAGVTLSTSQTFLHYYTQAASKCNYHGGATDNRFCQILANLCVLQFYDGSTQACKAFQQVASNRGNDLNNNITNWAKGAPWIYYDDGFGGSQVCQTQLYKTKLTLRNNYLIFVVASYYMNGTFAGFQRLETLFSYCSRDAPYSQDGGGEGTSTKWQFFANTQQATYECNLRTLLSKTQMFYEIFLHDEMTGKYTPIPIRMLDMRYSKSGGTAVRNFMNARQSDLCDGGDILVRRFFMYDIVSGIANAGADPQIIRYASFISLRGLTIATDMSAMYPPVVTIGYQESELSAWAPLSAGSTVSDQVVTYSFESVYTMNMSDFFKVLFGFFIAQIILAVFFFAIRYYNWNIRMSRVVTTAQMTTNLGGANLANIAEVMFMGLNSYVLMFFPFTVLVCWYFFVFFKLQSVPSIMLPIQDNVYDKKSPYYPFVVNLYIMTFFQVFYVLLMLVYRQGTADMFFIDWEPAKERNGKDSHQISVWRTILVANEYYEMQTIRRTDIRLTLFFLGFFLLGLGLENNATQQPDLNDTSSGEINILLRFANTTFFWLILSLAQFLWKWLLYERYLGEPPEQIFVDFCTLAKVSMIIFDEKYHGYYLHCRSPHQYADGTMVELVEMLHKEEAGLTVDRSLEGAPADVQSFQVFWSAESRTEFDRINALLSKPLTINEILDQRRNRTLQQNQRGSLLNNPSTSNGIWSNIRRPGRRGQQNGGLLLGLAFQPIPSEKIMKAWSEMLNYLQQFVENNYGDPGLRRTIREPSYYERMTFAGPDLSQPKQPSVFFTDRYFQYVKVLFLGREWDLLLFNILTYSIFDLWFDNTMVSILLCYLADYVIKYIRQTLAHSTISKKTLIDARFLI